MHLLSDRINRLEESQTLAMTRKSRELQKQGIDIINLSLGEPDFNTPDFIKDAAKKAIDDNFTHYMPVAGYLDLREAISEKFRRDNQLNYTPEQIIVSTGAKQALANAMLCLLNAGDEVLVPAPYWVSYVEMIKLADAVPVIVPSSIENNFKVTPAQLKKYITPKTRMMIFSSPCNPTGTVYTQEELKSIAKLISGYDNIYIVSDEIYEHINFAGRHQSIGQFDFIYDRVVTINGVSKGFAMTGWRIGYLGAALPVAKACDKMQGQFTSGASSIAQKAAKAAVSTDSSVTHQMRDEFKRRRDLVLKIIKDIPGIKANVPEGAFYIFPDVTYYFGKKYGDHKILNATDLCMYLLTNAHVALVTGEAFGDPNCLRFSYAASESKLVEALKRMKEALALLR